VQTTFRATSYPSWRGHNRVSDLLSELRCRKKLFGTRGELCSGQPAVAVRAGRYGTLRMPGVADVGQP
jgi:hypothetical protein